MDDDAWKTLLEQQPLVGRILQENVRENTSRAEAAESKLASVQEQLQRLQQQFEQALRQQQSNGHLPRSLDDGLSSTNTSLDLLHVDDANEQSSSVKASKKLAFVFAMSRIFVVGTIACTAALLALTVLIAFPGSYDYVARAGASQLFFVLAVSFSMFGSSWLMCYAPTPLTLMVSLIVNGSFSALVAAYGYLVYYDWLVVVMGGLLSFTMLGLSRRYRDVFTALSCLAVEEHTLESWLTNFRLFAVVAAPIVASFIRNDGATTFVPLWAILAYVLGATSTVVMLRIMYAAYPSATSFGALLQFMNVSQIIKTFGGPTLVILCFIAFYLVEISGASEQLPLSAEIIMISLAVVGYIMYAGVRVAISTNSKMLFVLSNPVGPTQLACLQDAGRRGRLERAAASKQK